MARVRKSIRRKPEKAQWMPWEPGFAKLFGMAPETYGPPEAVMVRGTLKGGTFTAIFKDEDGKNVRFRTRVGIDRATQKMWIIDQHFTLTAKFTRPAEVA